MRIGVSCLSLQHDIGGLRQYFHRLFRELLATDFNNSYVFFYSERNLPELELVGNDRWKGAAIRVEGEDDIRQHLNEIDLYFCPFGILSPRPVPIPSVVQIPDIQEVFYPQFFTEESLEFRRVHFAPSTKAADAVITLSEFSRNTIAEHHGISAEKIFVTSLVSDSTFCEQTSLLTLDHLNLPAVFILYPANHWQHKNHDLLLKSLKLIREEYGIVIPCVCTGLPMHNGYPLLEKIAEYGLSDQVRYVGYLSPEEMHLLYRKAQFLCFPSLFEGFGMPVLEAITAGCPVACSNAASIPEVAGDAAICFDPNDIEDAVSAILRLWQDADLRDDLLKRGKVRAAEFTAAAMATVHLEAFEYAVNNFQPPSYNFASPESIMSDITIATSIVPRNLELQRAAVNTWLELGFRVISINSAAEAAIVAQNFPDITLKIIDRTAESVTGKPYVYFDDVCKALAESGANICGIINSDIFLKADSEFADFAKDAAKTGLLFGSRIDVDSLENIDGEKYIYGLDFFFFDKKLIALYPESEFCLGAPWWDYWAPFVLMSRGVPCRELISPLAYHVRHETKWEGSLFADFGRIFSRNISRCCDFSRHLKDTDSPEQIAVFGLEVLEYILENSKKVVYPLSSVNNVRVEVGRSQYLKMREHVIEHHKEVWSLHDRIRMASNEACLQKAEIAEIHSSLSWRITKPLRWICDRLRGG